MYIVNLDCNANESFKYSLLLFLYYYNMKTNRTRISQLNKNLYPYIDIKFNENNDYIQFEKDNPHIDFFYYQY